MRSPETLFAPDSCGCDASALNECLAACQKELLRIACKRLGAQARNGDLAEEIVQRACLALVERGEQFLQQLREQGQDLRMYLGTRVIKEVRNYFYLRDRRRKHDAAVANIIQKEVTSIEFSSALEQEEFVKRLSSREQEVFDICRGERNEAEWPLTQKYLQKLTARILNAWNDFRRQD